MNMKIHYLKTVQPYFNEVKNGTKTFEHRRNDRDFKVGDRVHLQEYDMLHNSFSGEEVVVTITYVLTDRVGLDSDFCIFSFCKEEELCPQCKSTYISKGDKDNDSQCISCDFIW